MSANVATLLLGSNLGNPKENIIEALARLEEKCIVSARGDFHFSEAESFSSGNLFCNLAVEVKTALSPVQLLTFIKNIERKMGRTEDSGAEKRYTDRIIDIDIVLYGNICYYTDYLKIPHQLHLYERQFSRPVLASLKKNSGETEI